MNTGEIKILLVEDAVNPDFNLKEYLEVKKFFVEKAKTVKEVFDLLSKHKFDLCLLDSRMPFKVGFTLAKEIKTISKNTSIIFLAENSTKENIIEGLNVGADDYIIKPFHREELVMRIHAILRRTLIARANNIYEEYTIGKYVFNASTQNLALGKKIHKLTTKETELMRLLALNRNELLVRSFAVKTIWHENTHLNIRSMDVYIAKLRKYLKYDQKIEIVNIR